MATIADSFVNFYCSKCLYYGSYDANGYYCTSDDLLREASLADMEPAHDGKAITPIDPYLEYMSNYNMACSCFRDKAEYEAQQQAEKNAAAVPEPAKTQAPPAPTDPEQPPAGKKKKFWQK